jgi:hypothetical protein
MEAQDVELLYEQQIKPLPLPDQLRLIELIARNMAHSTTPESTSHSIMELHGLGADIWQNIDAQQYVNDLRKEWNT